MNSPTWQINISTKFSFISILRKLNASTTNNGRLVLFVLFNQQTMTNLGDKINYKLFLINAETDDNDTLNTRETKEKHKNFCAAFH